MTTTAPAPRRTAPGGGPRAVLVTGGAGFLGGAMCAHLIGLGWRVTVLDGCAFIHARS